MFTLNTQYSLYWAGTLNVQRIMLYMLNGHVTTRNESQPSFRVTLTSCPHD